MKILVIGGGGREHAIAWKAAQNPKVDIVYCAPGNGGTEAENKCRNVNAGGIEELLEFALREEIDLTIVGPEALLVEGIVDRFKKEGLRIFGPSKNGARLEESKSYAKSFMKKYGVRTASCRVFKELEEALPYLGECSYPIVIKADGLAAGKGVVICKTSEEAEEALRAFMERDILGEAAKCVLIEEYLEGVEASILSITDGNTIIPFISAKDHKTIYEDNLGPNTGGMGVVAPNPYCTPEVMEDFRKEIMEPTLRGIQGENLDFKGIIFFGLMITKGGTYLLEYNVRMGDPDTQAILPLMKNDLIELIESAINGNLLDFKMKWSSGFSCCVVGVSAGYPGKYESGYSIRGLEGIRGKAFISGADIRGKGLVTTGGRVLSIYNKGKNPEEARQKSYEDMKMVGFKGMYYRNDIGKI